MTTTTRPITPADAGCWLDGHFGWHNTYRVVELAEWHGFQLSAEDRETVFAYTNQLDSCDHDVMYEISDRATDYLQSLAPEGYVFVWDMGEFGLYAEDDVLD